MKSALKETKYRDSGLVFGSSLNMIRKAYEEDPVFAGELAISIIELTLTDEISTNDFNIGLALETLKPIISKHRERYDKKVESEKNYKRIKLSLDEIAELLSKGERQKDIADKLHISQQAVSKRIATMKMEYPEILVDYNIYNCNNEYNTNDNDNDIINENNNDNANANKKVTTNGIDNDNGIINSIKKIVNMPDNENEEGDGDIEMDEETSEEYDNTRVDDEDDEDLFC